MKFIKTKFEGLFLVETDKFDDKRGFLAKLYDSKTYSKENLNFSLTQIKYTYTKSKGTIRGLHMQSKPYEEAKIVHCVKGKIFEVALDLRPKSKTYSMWYGRVFSEKDKKSLFIPKGFAHGYQSLTPDCNILYMMSGQFSKPHNIGFRWDDPYFNISWPLKPTVIAKKDRTWLLFSK